MLDFDYPTSDMAKEDAMLFSRMNVFENKVLIVISDSEHFNIVTKIPDGCVSIVYFIYLNGREFK